MGWEVCTSEQWLAWSGLGDFAGSPLASSDSASTTQGPAPAGCDSPRDPSTPQASSCLYASCFLQPLPTGPSPVCALRFLAPCEVQQLGFSLWRQLSGPRKTWVWEAAAPSWFPCLVCNEWKPGPQAHYEVSKNLCASGLCFLLNQGVFNWCLTFPRQAKIWFFLQVRLNKQTKKSDPKRCRYPLKYWRGELPRSLHPPPFHAHSVGLLLWCWLISVFFSSLESHPSPIFCSFSCPDRRNAPEMSPSVWTSQKTRPFTF